MTLTANPLQTHTYFPLNYPTVKPSTKGQKILILFRCRNFRKKSVDTMFVWAQQFRESPSFRKGSRGGDDNKNELDKHHRHQIQKLQY